MDIVEIWKDIPGYEGLYQVSNLGRIWSIRRNRIIWCYPGDNNPYIRVTLTNQYGKTCTEKVHRLVALAFIPNPNNYTVVHHINENKQDNYVENLEWIDASEHSRRHHTGKESPLKGIHRTQDTKDKISKTKQENPTASYGFEGKVHSEQSKQKISDALKGKPKSQECKDKHKEKRWITNGEIELQVCQYDKLPEGFYFGRKFFNRQKPRKDN